MHGRICLHRQWVHSSALCATSKAVHEASCPALHDPYYLGATGNGVPGVYLHVHGGLSVSACHGRCNVSLPWLPGTLARMAALAPHVAEFKVLAPAWASLLAWSQSVWLTPRMGSPMLHAGALLGVWLSLRRWLPHGSS